ncbi:hypothetical protein GCM10009077_11820 [Roseibium denhamense]
MLGDKADKRGRDQIQKLFSAEGVDRWNGCIVQGKEAAEIAGMKQADGNRRG